jgi:hypothetical protein
MNRHASKLRPMGRVSRAAWRTRMRVAAPHLQLAPVAEGPVARGAHADAEEERKPLCRHIMASHVSTRQRPRMAAQRARTQAASAACAPVQTETLAPMSCSPHVTAAAIALLIVSTANKQ